MLYKCPNTLTFLHHSVTDTILVTRTITKSVTKIIFPIDTKHNHRGTKQKLGFQGALQRLLIQAVRYHKYFMLSTL